MKTLATILLVLVLLMEGLLPKGIGLGQDFKFGELITHFEEHKKNYSDDLSFWHFLKMHYEAGSEHTKHNHHDNLPCLDGHSFLVAITLAPSPVVWTAPGTKPSLSTKPISLYSNSYFFEFTWDFLNPPKLA